MKLDYVRLIVATLQSDHRILIPLSTIGTATNRRAQRKIYPLKPDEWGYSQLYSFAKGERNEVWSATEIRGQPYLYHLRAMYIEPCCEKCHGILILAFENGDLRGTTGLNLPLEKYYINIDEAQNKLLISHWGVWIAGLYRIILLAHSP